MLPFLLMINNEEIASKLTQLFFCYSKEMYRVAYGILKDVHEAEDVVQNAILRLVNHLDKITEIECKKTRAYLVMIVRNLAIDLYNQRKKGRFIPYDEIEDHEIAATSELEEHVLKLEVSKEMAQKLGELHPAYGDILVLRYYYEYSISEIAALLNLTEDNVSVRIYRGKAALRKLLDQGGENHAETSK